MKKLKIFIIAVAVMLLAIVTPVFSAAKPTNYATAGKGFAVIELFTSEGCSSCPPADELVARIQKEYNDQPVYILAFHVDYWNRLGWRDIFSSADYTKRQGAYAQYLHLPQVYTPQIVVNGKKEFVGSEEGTLRNAIKAGLQKPSTAQITLSNVKAGAQKLTLHYQAAGNGDNSRLLLALVQKSAQTSVKAGENKGRNLAHVQVVRQLQGSLLSNGKSGDESLVLPKDFNPQNWEIIGLLQNTTTGEIIGAARQALASAG
ncbi:thioredoxin family protein [Mucilaginibacter sp. UR6-11]|uniref:DUF1223 domain-containing protein n=1 Tax=Mucilaginibacter sp. UR6-11 TaxID=1435644 RepID=UPI001E53C1D7|nr:DUF1223 domain-containing protein [Mucilaginibacter sp. UR6-11]MCC8424442.1 DUF1223 domain-containing protein [Mucilaginibacter sp. UR6-11]